MRPILSRQLAARPKRVQKTAAAKPKPIRSPRPKPKPDPAPAPVIPTSHGSSAPELSLAIVVYGALFVLAGHVLPEVELAWMASVLPGIANVGALLVSETVLTLYLVKRIRIESPRTAYRPATALVAVGFLLLPFVGDAGAIPCMAVAFAGFGCFLVYLWIVMGNMAQRWSAAPIPTCAFGFMLLFSGIVLGELAAWTLYRVPSASATRRPSASSRCSCSSCLRGAWPTAPATPTRPPRWAACPSLPQFHQAQGRIPLPKAEAPRQARGLYAAAETYGWSPRGDGGDGASSWRGAPSPTSATSCSSPRAPQRPTCSHIYAKMNITGRPPRAHRPHRGLRLVTVPAMPSAKSVSRTEQPLSQKPEYRV